MRCCQCEGLETCFNKQRVAEELTRYRRKGAARATRMLNDAVKAAGVEGMTLLDIGGGVGAIQHALLQAGAITATSVEASIAYVEAAREEAQRHGLADRVSFYHGDFVALARDIPPADIVTLDRVICCYHDMPALVGLSAARADKLYGVVYPRDTWWMRMLNPVHNFVLRVLRRPIRFFVHPTAAVDAMVRANGLAPRFYGKSGLWQVVVYAR